VTGEVVLDKVLIFGLHSCAVAAQELGGTLKATARGPGVAPPSHWSCPISPSRRHPTPDGHATTHPGHRRLTGPEPQSLSGALAYSEQP
jgi:hypothetical protein